ncbi:MAG TPA: DUF4019 domain-containing protein [Candidatus Binataceae bacterium]|nr:DUF4019 domain-containing protein [Candidatus Binataceae bacterium]
MKSTLVNTRKPGGRPLRRSKRRRPRINSKKKMDETRAQLGAVTSRKFESATYARSLPGAPTGKYVVVVYATDFAGHRAAKEIVTPRLERDGHWRVSGYYIR